MYDGVQKSPQFPISHIIWSILWENKGPTTGVVISDGVLGGEFVKQRQDLFPVGAATWQLV